MSWKLRLFGYGIPLLGLGVAVFSNVVQVNPAPLWFFVHMGVLLVFIGTADYLRFK